VRLHARRCAAQRGLLSKIGASHKGKFFLHMIEHPIALFLKTPRGHFFHLSSGVEMQFLVGGKIRLTKCSRKSGELMRRLLSYKYLD
jgi:hypothetical protein